MFPRGRIEFEFDQFNSIQFNSSLNWSSVNSPLTRVKYVYSVEKERKRGPEGPRVSPNPTQPKLPNRPASLLPIPIPSHIPHLSIPFRKPTGVSVRSGPPHHFTAHYSWKSKAARVPAPSPALTRLALRSQTTPCIRFRGIPAVFILCVSQGRPWPGPGPENRIDSESWGWGRACFGFTRWNGEYETGCW